MSTTSKSVLELLRISYQVGSARLPATWCVKSNKLYTPAQLFSCLAMKTYLKMDYRGVARFISDFAEVRQILHMERAPHYTTLQKASSRLLKKSTAMMLLEETLWEHEKKLSTT